MSFGVLEVARREFALKIPSDVAIIGVDDVPEASHSAYDLTTFSQPAAALAKEAISIVDKMIADPNRRAIRTEVAGELIIRGSTRR